MPRKGSASVVVSHVMTCFNEAAASMPRKVDAHVRLALDVACFNEAAASMPRKERVEQADRTNFFSPLQ